MALVLIAYPELEQNDTAWIKRVKAQNPTLKHGNLASHFTLVFPTEDVEKTAFCRHVKTVMAGFKAFSFVIRCALAFRDYSSEDTYVFLVPDEGFSEFVQLHDALYSGILELSLRLDLPFVPHITVGYHPDAAFCKQITDDFNRQPFEIRGRIQHLDILEKTADGLFTVEHIHLNE
jgi:2'-5' RNA ligase